MSRGHASPRYHLRRRLAAAGAAVTAAGLAVAPATPATAATVPPPVPGLTVGVASVGGGAPETAVDIYYQRSDQRLVLKNGTGVLNLGGILTSGVAAISAKPGGAVRKTVAARGIDQAIWLRVWTAATGWQAWRSIGGKSLGAPGVTCVGDGAGDPLVYVRGTDRALYRYAAGAWTKLGGSPMTDPAGLGSVGSDCPGSEHAFVVNTDGYLWEWTPSGGFRRVGGRSTVSPSATVLPDGGVDLYARAVDNAAWVARRPAGAAAFQAFQKIGGTFTSAVTGFVDTTEPPDRLVLGIGTEGNLPIASDELGGDATWVWGEVP